VGGLNIVQFLLIEHCAVPYRRMSGRTGETSSHAAAIVCYIAFFLTLSDAASLVLFLSLADQAFGEDSMLLPEKVPRPSACGGDSRWPWQRRKLPWIFSTFFKRNDVLVMRVLAVPPRLYKDIGVFCDERGTRLFIRVVSD
jgi:hypothetical protein